MATVTLQSLCKRYGSDFAVQDLDLAIAQGELLALLGPSGCGKTTTLRMVAGFVPVSAGSILFDRRDITHLAPFQRNAGMVFQSYALFPHLSVWHNVAYGLQMRGVPKPEIQRRVAQALDWVQVAEYGQRLPKQLSGGQQQRVALARALVVEPDVLLLDEPLSNLDAKLRVEVRNEIHRLQRQAGITSIFVTHDQGEAMAIADRIGIMHAGRLVQLGTAEDIYRRPASRFVASFIGQCNFLDGQVAADGCFELADGRRLRFEGQAPTGASAYCIRPEHLDIRSQADDQGAGMQAVVTSVKYLGPVSEIEAVTASGTTLVAHLQAARMNAPPRPGDRIELGWSAAHAFLV